MIKLNVQIELDINGQKFSLDMEQARKIFKELNQQAKAIQKDLEDIAKVEITEDANVKLEP